MMNLASGIQTEVERHQATMQKLVKEFRARIEGLPDNPHATRLGKNCFALSSSQLQKNWSVEHHDYKTQYRHLSEMVQKNPERAIHIVFEAVRRETIRVGDGEHRFTINLHPVVVKHLRGFLESEGINFA
jgi:hypothetical protein